MTFFAPALPVQPTSAGSGTMLKIYRDSIATNESLLVRTLVSNFVRRPLTFPSIVKRLNALRQIADLSFAAGTEQLALDWLNTFYSAARSVSEEWTEPFVTVSPEEEIVFEWQQGEKLLVVYVTSNEITYVRSWGSDMFEEMEEGDASDFKNCRSLWLWFSRKNG